MVGVGIDVSKSKISCAYLGQVKEFANSSSGFQELWAWAGKSEVWCMEATGRYHEDLAGFAFEKGCRTLVVNPGLAKKYLGFVSARSKTDKVDALGLARLAEQEGEHLRAYKPVPEEVALARDILVRRRALVDARVSLEQVMSQTGDVGGHLRGAVDEMTRAVKELEKELAQSLKSFPSYTHLLTIPGIGPMSAALLVCTLERGEFETSDSLVAYAGLDPRANDSGKKRGTRRLSHQGDAQLRTVLFMGARAAARLPIWKPYYQAQLDKGLASTAATVILARKLLRVAWSVYKQKAPFVNKQLDKQT